MKKVKILYALWAYNEAVNFRKIVEDDVSLSDLLDYFCERTNWR